MTACSAQPMTFAEAKSTLSLGDIAMAPADFTIADGPSGGRMLTIASEG